MAKYKVIDVSYWQGDIDWKKVAADGVKAAIIRYADGTTLDSKFNQNMKGAKAAGLHVGCYIYSRAKTKEGAEKEATRLYNAAKGYNPDLPLYIDMEANEIRKYANTVAQAFIKKIEALGGHAGVYANLKWFNSYLSDTLYKYKDRPMWIAQYYSKISHKHPTLFGMWQYSNNGRVKGITANKGRVDMDWLYVAYWDKYAPKQKARVAETPVVNTSPAVQTTKKTYSGTFPSLHLVKTNAQVIEDAIRWAIWIAGDNKFHYGKGKYAHRCGCYFCGNEQRKKDHGIKNWDRTYVCNTFVQAALAHGGCIPAFLKSCQSLKGYSGENYKKSKLFNQIEKKKANLKPGMVFVHKNGHISLYIGNNKVAQAAGEDDNVPNSKSWNKSISVSEMSSKFWTGGKYSVSEVYQYIGSVDTTVPIRFGEISDRVKDLQAFLKWYGCNVAVDRYFGNGTLTAVKKFQKETGLTVDGIVGEKTIAKMKTILL